MFAFLVLIAVLIFRPSGLLGERVSRSRLRRRMQQPVRHREAIPRLPGSASRSIARGAARAAVRAGRRIGTAWVRITNLAILFAACWRSGLNIVVGFAGLLDLGYIAFYAVGAYVYALLA